MVVVYVAAYTGFAGIKNESSGMLIATAINRAFNLVVFGFGFLLKFFNKI